VNDETGAPAIDPAVLLKVVFMALSADTRPHFTTTANFLSSMDAVIVSLFVYAQAFDDVHEAAHVKEIVEAVDAIAAVLGAGIDAYIAAPHFRKGDPRFARTGRAKATQAGPSKDIHSTVETARCDLNVSGVLSRR